MLHIFKYQYYKTNNFTDGKFIDKSRSPNICIFYFIKKKYYL